MKKEIKDLYNVELLKYAYQKGVEYLSVQKQFANFEKEIKNKIAKYSNKVKEENKVFDLTKKLEKAKAKMEKMGSIDSAYEKYYQNKLSLPELEKILQTKKDFVDLSNKLGEANKKTKKLIDGYKLKILAETKDEYETLKQNVIEKGLATLCVYSEKWKEFDPEDYNLDQKQIDAFKKCFLKNSFTYLNEYTDDDNWAGSFEMIRQWFYNNDGFVPLHFDNKKIVVGLPSPFGFYLNQIKKQYGKDFEKVTIVTNDFSDEYWDRDDVTDDAYWGDHYFVYVATILAPKEIAEKLKQTEKQQTKESLQKLFKNNNNIMVLNADEYEYGKTDHKPKWTEEMREKIRQKIDSGNARYFEKSANASFCEQFGYYEGYHYYGADTEIVKVPNEKIANAIFETLEYVNKLEKMNKLKINKDRNHEEVDELYEELTKE